MLLECGELRYRKQEKKHTAQVTYIQHDLQKYRSCEVSRLLTFYLRLHMFWWAHIYLETLAILISLGINCTISVLFR